jgi:SAM-dependent methyltransferase
MIKKINLEKCPICQTNCSPKCFKFPGYLEGTSFDIFCCKKCDTNFIPKEKYQRGIYTKIYKQTKTPGYENYYKYAIEIKKHKNPLRYLAQQEPGYFPAYKLLKNKKRLKILEIGCSYGYLSYALKKEGHDVLGIDCSKKAINFAKLNFGEYYKNVSIEKLSPNETFDIILAIEIMEHLKDPVKFIKKCNQLLKTKGILIIATPNKDSKLKSQIWCSDLPPVHTCCLGKKSLEYIAKKEGFNCNFIDFSRYYSSKENKLLRLFESRYKNKIPSPRLDRNDKPIEEIKMKVPKTLKKILLWTPINYISHLISYFTPYECTTLGAILTKE